MTDTHHVALHTRGADHLTTAYETAVLADDAAASATAVEDLLTDGMDPVTLLTEVVARVQRGIGWRWQRGLISVADERAATALAMRATGIVADVVRDRPRTQGSVLITCAEREWHALPAMIIDCAARAAGWGTTLLGSSTTLARLNHDLDRLAPDVLAVSASVLGSLPTARRFIEASTAVGIPVLVGGAAFGPDATRALALGATAWAADAATAITELAALPVVVSPAPPLPAAAADEHAALSEAHRHIVAVVRLRWERVATVAATDDPNSVIDVADDVVHHILHALHAYLLTADPRVLPQTAAWVTDVMAARGGENAMLVELAELLRTALRDYPLSAAAYTAHLVPHLTLSSPPGQP